MISDEARAHFRAPTDLAVVFLGAVQAAFERNDLRAFADAWDLCDRDYQKRWSSECAAGEDLTLSVLVNRMINHLILMFPPIEQQCVVSAHQEPQTVDLVLVRIHDNALVDQDKAVTTERSHASAVPMMMRWDGTGWLVHDIGWDFVRPDGY